MKNLLAAFAIVLSSSVLAAPIMSVASLSETDFRDATSSGVLAAYAAYRVGDSLSQDPYYFTGEPELLLGRAPSAITQTAQFDWPVNWMSSSFSLSFHRADRTLSLYLGSSDRNSRPATASASLSTVGNFNTLLVAGTAYVAAMYVSPLTINGNRFPSLSPNGYGYSDTAHFAGLRLTGDILNDDFIISGTTYFDGGRQTGDSNRLEFALAQMSQVPEPSVFALMCVSFPIFAAFSRRRHLGRQRNA